MQQSHIQGGVCVLAANTEAARAPSLPAALLLTLWIMHV